jgi:hypothetical protein
MDAFYWNQPRRRPKADRSGCNMNIEVIGIDHIYLSVSDLARSESFYDRTMPAGSGKTVSSTKATDTFSTTIATSDSC